MWKVQSNITWFLWLKSPLEVYDNVFCKGETEANISHNSGGFGFLLHVTLCLTKYLPHLLGTWTWDLVSWTGRLHLSNILI